MVTLIIFLSLRDSVTRFLTIFFAEKIRAGPLMIRLKRFRELFRFFKDIQSQTMSMRTPEFVFRYRGFQIFKLLLLDV